MTAASDPNVINGSPSSGSIFYQDDYERIYRVVWSFAGGILDITTYTADPFVWGEDGPMKPIIRDGILYKRGMVAVIRQTIAEHQDGYVVLSEGQSQDVAEFQASFPCGPQPSDPFLYHLDNEIIDDVETIVTDGPRWADPANPSDSALAWVDPATPTVGGGFAWVDVWNN